MSQSQVWAVLCKSNDPGTAHPEAKIWDVITRDASSTFWQMYIPSVTKAIAEQTADALNAGGGER